MALTATGIALLGSAASAGYGAKRGHDQQVQAQHAQNDQIRAQAAVDTSAADKEKANKTAADEQIALRRRRALGMATQGRYGTIRTTPLGVPKSPTTGGNTMLGAA